MSFFPSLGLDAAVRNAMGLNPAASRLLIAYHTQILRGPSPLSAAERELIAAYVSGLNACTYCHGVHAATVPGSRTQAPADLSLCPQTDPHSDSNGAQRRQGRVRRRLG
jgi:alkylhydroperoxidase family enzyme